MRRVWLGVIVLCLCGLTGRAQERLVLNTAIQVSPGATTFRIWILQIRRVHPDIEALIRVVFREADGSGFVDGGKSAVCEIHGETADNLIVALNKVDLSSNSLEKRVINQCQSVGQIGPGTIVGVPQE